MRTAEAILTAITGETDLSAHWKIRKAITAAQREAFAAGVEAAAAFVAHGEYTGEPVTQADAEDLAARIRSIKFPEDVK